jgi:hypothetical protein
MEPDDAVGPVTALAHWHEDIVETRSPQMTVIPLSGSIPHPADQREDERFVTLLRVGSVTFDGQRQLCLIRNVSRRGMMVRTYSDVAPGTRLSIEFKHGESVVGTARWVRDGNVGLTFDHDVDVLQLLASAMDGPRARMPRVEIDAVAWVRAGATVHRVRALDISQGGLKIRSEHPLKMRDAVVVTLPGMAPVAGVICWADDAYFGVSLNEVLPLETLIRWLKAQRQDQPCLRASA